MERRREQVNKKKERVTDFRNAGARRKTGMARIKRMRHSGKHDTGQVPGFPDQSGERLAVKPRIMVFGYDEHQEINLLPGSIEECTGLRERYKVVWIDIDSLNDVTLIEEAARIFGLHPLTLEDILQTGQRPKIEDFDNYLYLLLGTSEIDGSTGSIRDEQMSIVIGKDFVITFQERSGDMFDAVRARIKNPGTGLRKRGADYLAYMLVDAIVDSYFVILDSLENRIDVLDQELFSNTGKDTFQAIYTLKKDLIQLRKAERPLREIINRIVMERYEVIGEETAGPFFRDVYDNVILINETIETYRDIVLGMYDTWLALINNRMNDIFV
jgi:magnesium transporter